MRKERKEGRTGRRIEEEQEKEKEKEKEDQEKHFPTFVVERLPIVRGH